MMHVSVITCLVILVPILLARSFPVDDEYSSSSSDYSSADYTEVPISNPEVAFSLNDLNHDGYITHKEYMKSNPRTQDFEAKHIFANYDRDRDSRISMEEYVSQVQHVAPKSKGDCVTSIIQTCSSEFIDAVQRWGDRQGDAVCYGLPIYKECIERERKLCSDESDWDEQYLNDQVASLVTRFRRSLCQDDYMSKVKSPTQTTATTNTRDTSTSAPSPLTSSVLSTGTESTTTSESVVSRLRKARSVRRESKRSRARSRRQSCIVPTVRPCDKVFVAALQAGEEDPCDSLVKYRHCIHKSTRRCSDPNLPHIQRVIRFLTKEHRRLKICGRFE